MTFTDFTYGFWNCFRSYILREVAWIFLYLALLQGILFKFNAMVNQGRRHRKTICIVKNELLSAKRQGVRRRDIILYYFLGFAFVVSYKDFSVSGSIKLFHYILLHIVQVNKKKLFFQKSFDGKKQQKCVLSKKLKIYLFSPNLVSFYLWVAVLVLHCTSCQILQSK